MYKDTERIYYLKCRSTTGLVKVGDNYINPHNITHIGKNNDGGTYVTFNTVAQGMYGIAPVSDLIPVNSNQFANCAIKAMQTGEIIDIMA